MANEAKITSHLQLLKGSGSTTLIDYRSLPTSFSSDVTGTKGPVPGSISITTEGTDVDFSELVTPTLCVLRNQDATNWVSYGIYDPEGLTYYPLGEIGPGEGYTIKLSRDLESEFGTGTGTSGADTNKLRLKADTATVNVSVEAFEL